MVLTRLNRTSFSGNKLPFSELTLHEGQSVHVIWTETSSVHEVSTFKPPLCMTSIPIKITWPFCFYEF